MISFQVEEILEKTLFEAKVRTIDLDNTVANAMEQVMMICDGNHDDHDHGNDDHDYDHHHHHAYDDDDQ